MEAENQQLKQALTQKTSQVKTLESRLTSTQLDLQESQEKVKRPHWSKRCFYCSLLCSCSNQPEVLLQFLLLNCLSEVDPGRDTAECIQSRHSHLQLGRAANSNSSIHNFSDCCLELVQASEL